MNAAPVTENSSVQAHIVPECYRFDTRLGEARVVAAPAADDSKFLHQVRFDSGAEVWTVSEGSARCEVRDNALIVDTETPTHCDSPILSATPATRVSAVFVDARISGCSEFSLAWRGENAEYLKVSESRIDVAPSHDWTLYQVDTAALKGWNSDLGNLNQLRLILPGKSRIEVRSISFVETVDPFAGQAYGQIDYALQSRYWVHALFARTPCALDYDVTVMPDARLTMGLLVPSSDATDFRIVLNDGAAQSVLVEERLDNANAPRKVDADLSPWSGRKVRIRFEAKSEGAGKVALWCNPSLERVHAVTAPRRPINVIWYVIDCLRAENVNVYGYDRKTSDAMDAVARDGARFEWCFSPGSWTVDSVASYFTGLSPNAHGLLRKHTSLPESMHALPEIMRANGYSTGLFTQNPYLEKRLGYVRGFDVARRFRVRDGVSRRGGTADTYPINVTIEKFLNEYKERPFFLYVHTIEPHGPYIPPASLRVFRQPDGSVTQLDLYDDCILWADLNLEHTIRKLKENGLWNNTLLIISADHGQSFPERDDGLSGHGEAPYLSRARIPLIMRLPGIIPKGAVITENVQGLDVPRTLFDLLHIEPDPQFDGWSLLGLLDGSRKAEFAQRSVFSSGQLSKWQAVVSDRWFFLDNAGTGELIDLYTNPHQSANVVQAHPDLARRFMEETGKYRDLEIARSNQYLGVSTERVEVNAENRRALEALGYVGARDSP